MKSALRSTDLETFRRSLNLRVHWADQERETTNSLISRISKSDWSPPDYIPPNDPGWLQFTQQCLEPRQSSHPNSNFTPAARAAWRELVDNPRFYLIKADKGGKLVLWSRSDYRTEALRQLSDRNTYTELTKIEADRLFNTLSILRSGLIRDLFKAGNISFNEQTRLLNEKASLPSIYFLPKIHKPKRPDTATFAGRPIIAAFTGRMKSLDAFLAALTAPLLNIMPGSLRDTKDLLIALSRLPPIPNAVLFSADVDSLYPSIPWDEGIRAAVSYYTSNYDILKRKAVENSVLPPPSPSLFRRTLELVIKHNYFTFQNEKFYHQISGTAMGCSVSVYFANAFMFYRTSNLIFNPPPQLAFFSRYIDDLVGIWTGDPAQIEPTFNCITDQHIHLTYVIGGDKLEALDLTISLDGDGRISTTLFRKPTDGHQFVHWSSHHPPHLKRSLPYSQLIRLKRNCSRVEDFEAEARILLDRFRARSYPDDVLLPALEKVRQIPRESLLNTTRDGNPTDRLNLVTTYEAGWSSQLRTALHQFYPTLRTRFTALPEDLPRLAFRVHRNLGSHLGPAFKRGRP